MAKILTYDDIKVGRVYGYASYRLTIQYKGRINNLNGLFRIHALVNGIGDTGRLVDLTVLAKNLKSTTITDVSEIWELMNSMT